ncbi:transcriptional regulator [Methyloversatilis discipulorum]|uniref:transcriptional regulator n=1 Tax=Methyloversatilis discipulorum TaxID=1119528 RepID=UPI000361B116|nr:YdaS family helix-turn-helix protein [Methyloversatilis discipulorum]
MKLETYLSEVESAASLAAKLEVTPSFISQIVTGRKPVPAERCSEIERATGGAVTCEELRPDLADHWAYLRGTQAAA